MKIKTFIVIALYCSLIPLNGQDTRQNISFILGNLYSRILNSNTDEERVRINDSVKLIVGNYVLSDSVFTHRFSDVRNLGQIESPDKQIKIVTWNLPLRTGGNKYFLYIIRKGSRRNENRIYELAGENRKEAIKTDIQYSAEEWYGAMYYTIQPFKIRRETSYILLGLDSDNNSFSRKIIEVLSFSEDGEITFGKECLMRGNEPKFREVLEYSADGVVSLRLNSKKLIVFDHLTSFSTGHENNSQTYGADGQSFDGYVFKKGIWKFISDIDVRNFK